MIPSYGNRIGWIPSCVEDFDDGGAYPEINVPQSPFDGQQLTKMVKMNKFLPPTNIGPVDCNNVAEEKLLKPDQEALKATIEKTRAALEALTKTKISASLPNKSESVAPPKYIKYISQTSASQKIIRMVDIQKDPCEPPKFRINKKIPQGPPSPPAPVIHSPPRKLSVKDQKEWRIPPCISNWKNPKGYTIPLDKRLAADGGSQSVSINDKFATLAEALFIADKKAREGVEMRAKMEKKLASKEKEKKEDLLKKLAQKAREERAGLIKTTGDEDEDEEERNQIRLQKQREARRDRNIERAAPHIKNKHAREREITEQIALNMANPKVSNEVNFDSRLVDQTRGIASGFADDDDYAVYDKPWKTQNQIGNSIYRPRGLNEGGPVPFVASSSTPANEDIFGIDSFLKEAKKSTKRKFDN